MPAIYAELTPPFAKLEAVHERITRSPAIMATLHKRSMTRLGQRALTVLRVEPPPVASPIRWKTARQRRAYFATNGFGHGIPYVRTHAIAQGWKYKVVALDNGGEVVVYNEAQAAGFVEGFEQQPFHEITGWLYAPPILANFSGEAEQITVQNFQTAFDPFGGVPR